LVDAALSAAKERPGPAFIELSTIPQVGEVRRQALLDFFGGSHLATHRSKDDLATQIESLNIPSLTKPAVDSLAKHYRNMPSLTKSIYKAAHEGPGGHYKAIADHPGI